jgi:hypothetical protein
MSTTAKLDSTAICAETHIECALYSVFVTLLSVWFILITEQIITLLIPDLFDVTN